MKNSKGHTRISSLTSAGTLNVLSIVSTYSDLGANTSVLYVRPHRKCLFTSDGELQLERLYQDGVILSYA